MSDSSVLFDPLYNLECLIEHHSKRRPFIDGAPNNTVRTTVQKTHNRIELNFMNHKGRNSFIMAAKRKGKNIK